MVTYKIWRGVALRIAFGITMLVILLAEMSSAVPVEEWNKTFGGEHGENAIYVYQTSDLNYTLIGSKESQVGFNTWFVKTDSYGNELHNKTLVEGIYNYPYFANKISDGGYLIVGSLGSPINDNDAWVIKTDSEGNEIWNKTFKETSADERFYFFKQISNEEYTFIGMSYSGGPTNNLIQIKTDLNGNELWNKSLLIGCYELRNIHDTLDNAYVVSLLSCTQADTKIIKIDSNGNELWNRTFEYSIINSIQQTSDDGFVLAGNKELAGTIDYDDGLLIKTDSNGNELWNKTYQERNNYSEIFRSIKITSEGGFIIGGYSYDANGSHLIQGGYGWLVRTNSNGVELWNMTFGGIDSFRTDLINFVQETLDRGYILAGSTVSYGAGDYDAWLTKVSSEGSVHNMNKGITYTTIQLAIDDANPGDEIHVDSGTYYGTMKVNKQITLSSTSGNPIETILESPINSEDVINVSVDSVNISGFTLKNAFSMAGIYIGNGVDNSNISNNILMSNYFGIKLDYSNNNTLSGNKAFNNRLGIVLAHSNDNILKRNNASDNSYGINVAGLSSNNILVANIASSNNGYGLGRGDGIGINSWGNNNTLSGNTANLNNDSGIFLRSSTNILIENSVSKNDQGIYMEFSDSNTVNSNNVANNNIGVYLWSSITNNINNNYFNNTNNYIQEGIISGNTWNTTKTPGINIIGAPSLGGNFWAYPNGTGFSQICTDANKDGICDSPYVLDANNVDYLPLTIPSGYGYIYGTLLNNSTGIAGVTISTNTSITTNTDESGRYSILVLAGAYNLIATSEPKFYTNSSVTVTIVSGTTVLQDIELIKKPIGNINGLVTNV